MRIDRRCEDAIEVYQTGLKSGAVGFIGAEAHLGLAVCYDTLAQPDKAKAEIQAAREAFPGANVALFRSAFTFTDEAYEETWLATLECLGIPVEYLLINTT